MSEPVEKCSNCGILIAESKHALHEVYCIRNNIKCQRCGQFYDKNDLEGHNEEFHSKVQCQHCKQEFDNLNNHKCSKRPIACKFCKLDQPNDLIFQHENVCGSRTGNCQICNKPIMLRELEKHENTCVGVVEQKKPIQTQYQVRPSSSEKADKPIERGMFDRQFDQPRPQPQPYEYNARQNPPKIEPQKVQQQPTIPVANNKYEKPKQPIFENKPSEVPVRQAPQQPTNNYKPSSQQPAQQPIQQPVQIPSYLKPENSRVPNSNPLPHNQPINNNVRQQQNQFAQFNQQPPQQQRPAIQKIEKPQEKPNEKPQDRPIGSSHNDRSKPLVKQDSYNNRPLQTYGQQPRQVPQIKPNIEEGPKIIDARQNRDNKDNRDVRDYNNRDNREKISNFDNKYDKDKYRNQVDQKSNNPYNGEFRQPNVSRQVPQNDQRLTRPDTAANRQIAQQIQMAEEMGMTLEELEQQLQFEKQFEEKKKSQEENKKKLYNDPYAERQFAQRRDQEQRQQKKEVDYHQYFGGDEDEDLQKAILISQNLK